MANENLGKQSPDELRRDIVKTRSHMEQNVQALQTRLNPERLKSEAKDTIREQTVGRVEDFADSATETVKGTGADVFNTIKQNPLPAALAAIGLGWLFIERRNTDRQQLSGGRSMRRSAQGRSYYDQGYNYRDRDLYADEYAAGHEYGRAERGPSYGREPMDQMRERAGDMRENAGQMAGRAREGVRHAADSMSDTASQVVGSVGDKASQVAGSVGDKAGQVATTMSDAAGQVATTVSDAASQVASTVSDTASNVGDTASYVATQARQGAGELADAAQRGVYQAKTRFEALLNDNPLLIGAAAVALGAAIGMGLPGTRQEDKLLGEARDNLMTKAQERASDTMDKVQQVAEKATTAAKDAAKEEAQTQKLTV